MDAIIPDNGPATANSISSCLFFGDVFSEVIELVMPLMIEGTRVGMVISKFLDLATARCAASWVNCSAKKDRNKGTDISVSHDRSVGMPASASSIAAVARSKSLEFAKKGAMDPYQAVAIPMPEMAVRKITAGSRATSGPATYKTCGQFNGSNITVSSWLGNGSLSTKKEILSRRRASFAIRLSSFSISSSPEPHSFCPRMIQPPGTDIGSEFGIKALVGATTSFRKVSTCLLSGVWSSLRVDWG
mmetsp:Transcript_17552/g.37965  ORF Transcript_17552/g.37965 Transcript_17552/m.37965 type:complete len:245 (-) Transcript_17552:1537-2271(-)